VKASRRDFLKLAGAVSATVAGADTLAAGQINPRTYDNAFGVLVDTTICIGCRKCEWACNQANNLPSQNIKAFEDKSVFQVQRRPTDVAYTMVNAYRDTSGPDGQRYLKVQCMHCNEPACVSACIVGAFRKNEKGPVTYDAWKCMGCRYCMVACPFQVPAYEYRNALDPQVRKCQFCKERIIDQGKRPACVEICPNEALIFGSRHELLELAHERIKQMPERYFDHVYGEHEVGGTSWMYLAAMDFSKMELPRLDDRPIPERTESIQHGIFKSFIPPIALYGLLALVMHTFKGRGKNEQS
jgi:formate dehydrogenase iron-sulfur subunit